MKKITKKRLHNALFEMAKRRTRRADGTMREKELLAALVAVMAATERPDSAERRELAELLMAGDH